MKIVVSTGYLLLSSLWIVASTSRSFAGPHFAVATRSSSSALFGVRGGGLFGGSNKDEKSKGDASDSAGGGEKYPPLSDTEIEEWLEHIPVFAVTDSNGAGVVLKPENETSVFYFFLNPLQANATLQQLKSVNAELDLKVSAFSLGKIWFPMLRSGDNKKESGDDVDGQAAKDLEYRLVPDTRDLLGARMLLTMTPEDGEKLKESPEAAQQALQKAMTESPKFKNTFNEIPVFTIAQMRMQKQATEPNEETVTLLPMYFSLQNMIATWQNFMSQAPPDVQGVEPAINLLGLHDLVGMMQQESEVDWRHVVLVPPTAEATSAGPRGASPSSVAGAGGADSMAQMGGAALLGDDDE